MSLNKFLTKKKKIKIRYLEASLFAKLIEAGRYSCSNSCDHEARAANAAASRIRSALSKIIRDKRSPRCVINARIGDITRAGECNALGQSRVHIWICEESLAKRARYSAPVVPTGIYLIAINEERYYGEGSCLS